MGKYYLGDILNKYQIILNTLAENELWVAVEKELTPKTDRYKRDFGKKE